VTEPLIAMTDTAWPIVAVVGGALIAATWIARERAIRRRRQQRSHGEETKA